MTEENLIKTATVGYPRIISIQDAVGLLDQTIITIQKEGYNILKVEHLGDNVFMIEYRGVN